MSGEFAGDVERSIYLAGPIEADNSPRSWRDEVRASHPEVDWIDPMDWQDEWEEDPCEVWEREMETVRNNAVLVCNIGDDAPRTTGTHHEIREALNHGQPVAIVPEGTVSQVYREVEDVWLYKEVDHAIADLTCAELVDNGLRTDGGSVGAGTDHSFEVGDELEKVDSSVWKITNRMVDVDTDETLYRLRESDVGPSNITEILTESQIERSFQTGTARDGDSA